MDRKLYQTEYGEMYALTIPDQPNRTGTIVLKSFCKFDKCGVNEYMDSHGSCRFCPPGSIAPAGSTSISGCIDCAAEGYIVEHSKSRQCFFDKSKHNPKLSSSTSWRLMAHKDQMNPSHCWWLVDNIKLFSSVSCDAKTELDWRNGTFFDSGNAGTKWAASAAFDTSQPNAWYGTDGGRKLLWIGIAFPTPVTVKCITFYQREPDSAREINIQAMNAVGTWETAWTATNLSQGNTQTSNKYTLPPTRGPTRVPTFAPSLAPARVPTFAPTAAPTTAPTLAPTRVPTAAPTRAPTTAPTRVPTAAPTSAAIIPTVAPVTPTYVPTMPTVVPVSPTSAPIMPTVSPVRPTSIPIQSQMPVKAPVQVRCIQRCTRIRYLLVRGYTMYQNTNGLCKKRCFLTVAAGRLQNYTCAPC
jgi:hypothetical protein